MKSKAIANRYKLTPRECEAHKAIVARSRRKLPSPRLKVTEKEGPDAIAPDHPDPATGFALLMESVGTDDVDFMVGLLEQLANVGSQGRRPDEKGINFMLSMVKGIEPKDAVEAMLAAQMAAVHNATMTFARRLAHVENIPQQDAAERAFNKLARTFATQLEALKRYRTGGEQKMTVEHVHVHEGGQAIVGNVQGGGGGAKKRRSTP